MADANSLSTGGMNIALPVAKPLLAALANLPCAKSDSALAASFEGNGYNMVGRLSNRDDLVFEFFRADGSCARYTAPQMRRMTWWYWLNEKYAKCIEANLFADDYERARPVSYVARADMDAGGLIIRGSRLSNYFEGESGSAQAFAECKKLKSTWPDAGVFSAENVEDAEQTLAAEDPLELSRQRQEARAAKARAERFAALLS